MGVNGRGKDLENVVAHSQPSYSRPATTLPSGVAVANNGGGFGSSGPNFFKFSDQVTYQIHIARGATSLADVVTYTLNFSTQPAKA